MLFSSAESYDYFESKNTNLETPITIFEKVAKTINNPHDSLADKIQEIQNAYDKQISEAEKKIEKENDLLDNNKKKKSKKDR